MFSRAWWSLGSHRGGVLELRRYMTCFSLHSAQGSVLSAVGRFRCDVRWGDRTSASEFTYNTPRAEHPLASFGGQRSLGRCSAEADSRLSIAGQCNATCRVLSAAYAWHVQFVEALSSMSRGCRNPSVDRRVCRQRVWLLVLDQPGRGHAASL